MNVINALILGIVQGVTEFLPISSSGHLILLERIMQVKTTSLAFELVCHLGTLLSIVVVMNKKLFAYIKSKQNLTNVIIATIPSAIIALTFRKFFPFLLGGKYLAVFFIVTAILLYCIRFFTRVSPLNKKKSFIVGAVQGIACIPGISRSGATLFSAKAQGIPSSVATDFSLIISIPLIIGSSAIELIGADLRLINFAPMIIGFITSFLVGILSIKILYKITKTNMNGIIIYLVCLSAFITVNDLFLHLF